MRHTETGDFQPFDAIRWKVGIAVAQFNQEITGNLLDSALKRAEDYRIPSENITVVKVAGALQISQGQREFYRAGNFDHSNIF